MNPHQTPLLAFCSGVERSKECAKLGPQTRNIKKHRRCPATVSALLIIEITGEKERGNKPLKEKEMRKVEKLNPERLKYEILETNRDEIGFREIEKVKKWVYKK